MTSELLHQRGQTTSAQSKTVRALRFDVPEGVSALALKFDYGPRWCDDVAVNAPLVNAAFERYLSTRRARGVPQEELDRVRRALDPDERAKRLHNLMNVTLIDPEGRWRGRWDRNPSSASGELVLAEGHASRGFLPGALPAGAWTAAVECHGIFGDAVDWEIHVRAREPLTEQEVAELAPATTPVRGSQRPGRRRGRGWYFGEMHSHTVHSDGKWEVLGLTTRAADAGADFLVLTDHNTVSGLLDPSELPLTLLPGIELTTFHGHHPIYGVRETVPWHRGDEVLPLAETGQHARALGALVGVAHPFVPGDPLCTGCRMVDGLDPSSFDAMEVWYRRWASSGADNVAAHELWNRAWAAGHRVIAVAARDWHGPEQDGPFPGDMPFTGIFAEERTPNALLAGLRAGRVILSNGPIAELSLCSADGLEAGIGGELFAREAPEIVARLDRLTNDPLRAGATCELRLYHSGKLARTVPVEGDGEVRLGHAESPGWFRLELWQGNTPRVITNHAVWGHAV